MKIAALVAMLALASPSVALADDTSQTISTYAQEETRDGSRYGCVIGFTHLVADYAYKKGSPVLLNGSMHVVNYPDRLPALAIKLVVEDVGKNDDGSVKLMPATPWNVSLVGTDGDTNAGSQLGRTPGETQGSLLVSYTLDDRGFSVLDRIVDKNQLSFVFNRRQGGSDVRVDIDLTVDKSGNHGTSTLGGYAACMSKLLDDMKRNPLVQGK